MKIIYTDAHLSHNPPSEIYDGVLESYAEKSSRAEVIIEALRTAELGPIIQPKHFPLKHIQAVHQKQYIDFLRSRSENLAKNAVLYPSFFMSDTYAPVTPGTFSSSLAAVDAALTGADLLLKGEQWAYSLCRPPGHHAAHHTMGGYCYFNNAAIAAHYLSSRGRVAILDIDFHHGNGTQDAFYDRGDVLYVSLHADPSNNYPYSSGFADERGSYEGQGTTINYPLAKTTSNRQYLRCLKQALADIEAFGPDYLIVSAGFDTLVSDPIAGLQLDETAYPLIGTAIATLQLPTLIVQEGGYDVAKLGTVVSEFLRSFTTASTAQ
jgi:acetoin utilization deacetylase AcuC-like enzyme